MAMGGGISVVWAQGGIFFYPNTTTTTTTKKNTKSVLFGIFRIFTRGNNSSIACICIFVY